MQKILTGNAEIDNEATRGWLVGHFFDQGNPAHSNDVEIKWGAHDAGETRDEWAEGKHEKNIAILISGKHTLIFPDQEVVLQKPGDYVIWPKGVPHKRRADRSGTLLTIRWPSV